MIFQQKIWFCLLILLPLPWLFLRKKGFLRNSNVDRLPASKLSKILHFLPDFLFISAEIFLTLALAKPTIPGEPTTTSIIGRDIIVAVDISPSMLEVMKDKPPEQESKIPELEPLMPATGMHQASKNYLNARGLKDGKLRRIDAAQTAVLSFIRSRYLAASGDRIGMIMFDERPRISWPLTHDLRMIYRKGQFVNEGLGMGTNFGQTNPGPIDKAVEQFKELGQADSKIIILVTDGEDELGSAFGRLYELLTQENVRLYVVGIGETLAGKDVEIMRLAELLGGKTFRVESTTALQECFATIDSFERSPITQESHATELDVFYRFAGIALILLVSAVFAELFIFNQ